MMISLYIVFLKKATHVKPGEDAHHSLSLEPHRSEYYSIDSPDNLKDKQCNLSVFENISLKKLRAGELLRRVSCIRDENQP